MWRFRNPHIWEEKPFGPGLEDSSAAHVGEGSYTYAGSLPSMLHNENRRESRNMQEASNAYDRSILCKFHPFETSTLLPRRDPFPERNHHARRQANDHRQLPTIGDNLFDHPEIAKMMPFPALPDRYLHYSELVTRRLCDLDNPQNGLVQPKFCFPLKPDRDGNYIEMQTHQPCRGCRHFRSEIETDPASKIESVPLIKLPVIAHGHGSHHAAPPDPTSDPTAGATAGTAGIPENELIQPHAEEDAGGYDADEEDENGQVTEGPEGISDDVDDGDGEAMEGIEGGEFDEEFVDEMDEDAIQEIQNDETIAHIENRGAGKGAVNSGHTTEDEQAVISMGGSTWRVIPLNDGSGQNRYEEVEGNGGGEASVDAMDEDGIDHFARNEPNAGDKHGGDSAKIEKNDDHDAAEDAQEVIFINGCAWRLAPRNDGRRRTWYERVPDHELDTVQEWQQAIDFP
ncbi:hypothetical protein L228DRAFT_260487 [Xylona heveae TC161]|uniref:Uncharacterized protein n=1 Tax=Xylona heveae (strain CBS 132557 / TC161) TaxID=1328760 RepID=A0A165HLV2_XYLHT|nr:hypothetical protein L228DRAFT_260487 [Xylona heveae TC161]KZF23711.1 hypothetical protein L228DRAFT_260487 [Xylona heveae TC161]